MAKFLFVTHGRMASGVKSTLEIIAGHFDNLTAIDAYVDSKNIVELVNDYFANISTNEQLIMLSDIENGSANQLLFKHLERSNTFLITGVNLPLVLQLALFDKPELKESELEEAIDEAKKSIKLFKDIENDEQDDESFF